MDDSSCPSAAAGLVDTSATVFTMLDDPPDLALIANHLSKLQCLWACPELSTFTHADITSTSSGYSSNLDQLHREHRVYTHLAQGLLSESEYKPRDCIIHCIGASTTDSFPEESIENTLEPIDRVEFRPSYWSSRGNADPDAPECLIYRLQADLCLVDEIRMQPFKAYFQHGHPIYSAKSIRFQMGYPRSPLRPEALVCNENEGQLIDDRNYVWTYTSPEFPMLQENFLQSFKLPRPIICIGGVVKVELLGRAQKQSIDGLYYIWVSHV